jgi:hypothetical protein
MRSRIAVGRWARVHGDGAVDGQSGVGRVACVGVSGRIAGNYKVPARAERAHSCARSRAQGAQNDTSLHARENVGRGCRNRQ